MNPDHLSSASYDAANELTQWGATVLTYDSNGNLANGGASTYGWDARNQLSSMGGSANGSFGYDAFGRRIGRNSTSFLFDGLNSVQELAGGSPTANVLAGGIDENFLRSDISGTWNFLTDALGSTNALADSTGTLQTRYTFEPFGNTTLTGAAEANSAQYIGRESDGNGLYYYRARYYSPSLQRFVSEDPTGFGGGINVYAYALDNPVSFTDPMGLDVTVTAYPGIHGNPFGHAGVSVNGSPAVGFEPAPGWDSVVLVGAFTPELGVVPGAVLPISPGRRLDPSCSFGSCSVTIPATPKQDQAMLDYIKNRTEHPGIYQMYGRNCTEFVYDVLRAGGIGAPYTPFPRELANGLAAGNH